jgi:hypothetical protein
MGLVILALFICSFAECSFPDTAASRRNRQRSKNRPEHHDQVRATHSERRRGKRPRHHGQGTAPRAAAWAPRPSTCDKQLPPHLSSVFLLLRRRRVAAGNGGLGTFPGHRDHVRVTEATSNGSLLEGISPRVLPFLCAHGACNIRFVPLLVCIVFFS